MNSSSKVGHLTHWGQVTHICISKLWLVQIMACHLAGTPSHYLNQCWYIVNWTLGHKLQWNLNPNLYIFIQEFQNAFENGVWKMVSILSHPQCVDMNKVFMLVYSGSVTRPEMDQNWLLLPWALGRFWHRVVLANYGVKKTTWECVGSMSEQLWVLIGRALSAQRRFDIGLMSPDNFSPTSVQRQPQ